MRRLSFPPDRGRAVRLRIAIANRTHFPRALRVRSRMAKIRAWRGVDEKREVRSEERGREEGPLTTLSSLTKCSLAQIASVRDVLSKCKRVSMGSRRISPSTTRHVRDRPNVRLLHEAYLPGDAKCLQFQE